MSSGGHSSNEVQQKKRSAGSVVQGCVFHYVLARTELIIFESQRENNSENKSSAYAQNVVHIK